MNSPVLESLHALIEHRLAARGATCGAFVFGLCGAQGSGKSTLVAALAERLAAAGRRCAVLSLDDLYVTRAERQALGTTVHPLLATRGVPGTHDVTLGLQVIDAVRRGLPVPLPRFDKATDDRLPASQWPRAPADAGVILFEGWCLGVPPQAECALAPPVNALERDEDAAGIWRRHVNAALDGPYRELWQAIDALAFLATPDFTTVCGWRRQQEQALRARLARSNRGASAGLMDDAALTRFMAHYERLTRHALATLPERADLTIRLDPDRRMLSPQPAVPIG